MKTFLYFLGMIVFGIIAAFILLAVLAGAQAVPDLLDWLSIYIGEFGSWILVIAIVLFIIWLINRDK